MMAEAAGLDLARARVMGILNVTPDSFSDGGLYFDRRAAVERGLEMEAQGASIIDVGGESTRPGSLPVSAREELDRVLPVICGLRERSPITISIDTTKSQVAAEAVAGGAAMINDISGLRFDPALADVAARSGAYLVLMHSRGTPENMQRLPAVDDIVAEVISGLRRSLAIALERGVSREKIIVDPGIGFGKTPRQNLLLIDNLDLVCAEFGLPVLLGASRKSFIARTLEGAPGTARIDRAAADLAGTIAANLIGVLKGARILRVHDVAETVAAVRLAEAVTASGRALE